MQTIATTLRAPRRIVFCESTACSPRGELPVAHAATADCKHPRTARLVVCDAHQMAGQKFATHPENTECVHPIVAGNGR